MRSGTLAGLDSIDWLPILEINCPGRPRTGRWIGLADEQQWSIDWGAEDGKLPTELQGPAFMGLLIILEQPWPRFRTALLDGIARQHLPLDVVAEFPLFAFLAYALDSGMAYWMDLALGWVEELGLTLETAWAMADLASSRQGSQPLRHRARRLLAAAPPL